MPDTKMLKEGHSAAQKYDSEASKVLCLRPVLTRPGPGCLSGVPVGLQELELLQRGQKCWLRLLDMQAQTRPWILSVLLPGLSQLFISSSSFLLSLVSYLLYGPPVIWSHDCLLGSDVFLQCQKSNSSAHHIHGRCQTSSASMWPQGHCKPVKERLKLVCRFL